MRKIKYISLPTILLVTIFFSGCDFTPKYLRLLKSAQDKVLEHEYNEAIKDYEKSAEIAPDDYKVQIKYQLGRLYSTYQQDFEKALLAFEFAAKFSTDTVIKARSYEELGEILFSYQKNFLRAKKIYRLLLDFKPILSRRPFYELRFALSHYQLHEWATARKLLQEISIEPKHEYSMLATYYLGRLEFENKNWDGAIVEMKKFINMNPDSADKVNAQFVIANSFENLNKLIEAYNLYSELLNNHPHPNIVRERMDAIYARRVAKKR